MKKGDTETTISIAVIDNKDWQPDMDFYINIYDESFTDKLPGDDTECKITILDEDFPGKLGFENTEIIASNVYQDQVDIIINRIDGQDGIISCILRTEPFIPDNKMDPHNAREKEDYIPIVD